MHGREREAAVPADAVLTERRGNVLLITINRPDVRNAVNGAVAEGIAGALEVAGPIGQLTAHFPVGYGFAAIIVAFVGRLHPPGVVLSALLMSMLYIGGELVQSRLGLPRALTEVFQGLLLFALLACDAVGQRLARRAGREAP